jgi:hypothetical protein
MPGMASDNRFVETTPTAAKRQLICPTGCFCDLAILAVQPFGKKYFAFPVGQIKITTRVIPPRLEGRTRRHERWVRDAVDAAAAQDERSYCGRQSRVVLTPRRWRQVGGNIRKRRWQESPVTGESAI